MLETPPEAQGWTTGDATSSDITTFLFQTYNGPSDGGPPPVLRLRLRMTELHATVDMMKKITEADIRSSWCEHVSVPVEAMASVHHRAFRSMLPRHLEWQVGLGTISVVDREMSFAWCNPLDEFAKRLRTLPFERSILENALKPTSDNAPVLVYWSKPFPALVKSLRLA